jgi:hypothetical protein
MTAHDLEGYLTRCGFDSRYAPEVYQTLVEAYYVDLSTTPCSVLSTPNDGIRMDIRNVVTRIHARRVETAVRRCVNLSDVPFRTS